MTKFNEPLEMAIRSWIIPRSCLIKSFVNQEKELVVSNDQKASVKNVMRRWNKFEKAKALYSRANSETHATAKGSEVWEGHLDGQKVERLIVYLRSSGCYFALATGGCTTCAHALDSTTLGIKISAANYVKQFINEYEHYGPQRFPLVCIYNEGSMLFDKELPTIALREILAWVRNSGGVKRVVLEARSEHVTSQALSIVKESTGSEIEIEVGIGLESTNDFVRNTIMLKETSLRSYERAVTILHEFGCKSLTYVLVKPPFLNEAQSLSDSLATAEYAFSVGTDAVSLEPVGVEQFTVVQDLFNRGLYAPASLWTVIAIAKKLNQKGEVRIGGQQFAPIPHTRSRTCDDPQCLNKVLTAVRDYNSTLDTAILDKTDHCCQRKWYNQIVNEDKLIDVNLLVHKIFEAVPLEVLNSRSIPFLSMIKPKS